MAIEKPQSIHFNDWPNDVGFEPHSEQREPVDLVISGTIPSYVSGVLYRTGPGGHEQKTEKGTTFTIDHWFDGFAQNHRFEIVPPSAGNSTRVIYNSRMASDMGLEYIRKTGKSDRFGFAIRDPCVSMFRKAMSMFVPVDIRPETTNVCVTISANMPGLNKKELTGYGEAFEKERHGSGVLSLFTKTDSARYQQIDPRTLEPIGAAQQTVLHPDLRGPFSAAHAKSDPITGDIYNYNLDIISSPIYRVFHVSAATGETDIIATITDAPAAYLHSIAVTENYVVLCIWGTHYAWGGKKVFWERNMLDAMTFDPKKPALWYVIDRKGGKGVIAKYEGQTFFSFHVINSWEEPSPNNPSETDIVYTLSLYDNMDIIHRMYYNNMKSSSATARAYENNENARPLVRQYRLPSIHSQTPSKSVPVHIDWTVPHENSAELPTINPAFVTRPNRYVFGLTDRGQSTFFDGLVKIDTKTLQPQVWTERGQNPGEPIFVANPAGTDEDDGVLLSVVLDGYKSHSYLLVLDAKTMKELARANMKGVVGFGFHGTYFPIQDVGPDTEQ